ncbi:MAG: hypothetical protein K1X67_24305 [Fimbriimonadaceae bacterium]|nr:hypothetical protein [Fimbriimonadaceae bacterium]
MPVTEVPKRLAPTRDTLRELYLKSGNRCAFPGCKKSLFNIKGVFVGQICHIEAAEPGGERFNKKQTNEQRRAPANLVLMCYDHHVETDDVDKFPVSAMVRIKTDHEKKFSDVVGTMLMTVTDHTTLTTALVPNNLTTINAVLKWGNSDEELGESLAELSKLIDKISKVPIPSRALFSILVKRGEKGRFGADLECSIAEIKQATNLSNNDLRECFSILDNTGLTFDNDVNDFGVQMVGIAEAKSGWPVWSDLKKFCKKKDLDISLMIEGLDFSSLEG